jgi:hypothetical protein
MPILRPLRKVLIPHMGEQLPSPHPKTHEGQDEAKVSANGLDDYGEILTLFNRETSPRHRSRLAVKADATVISGPPYCG